MGKVEKLFIVFLSYVKRLLCVFNLLIDKNKYDLVLLEGVDDVSRGIDNVEASIGTDGMPAAVNHLTRLSQGVIDTYNRRDEVILSTDA